MALEDIRIVLIEPAQPGNIGEVTRAMKAMSLTRVVLVSPNIRIGSSAESLRRHHQSTRMSNVTVTVPPAATLPTPLVMAPGVVTL